MKLPAAGVFPSTSLRCFPPDDSHVARRFDGHKLVDIVEGDAAGADDVSTVGDKFEITCDPDAFQAVSTALAAAEIETEVKEITRIPQNTVDLDASAAGKVLKLMERLDDHDDVQNVSANFNIPDDVMAKLDT